MFGFLRKKEVDVDKAAEPTVSKSQLLKTVNDSVSTIVDRTISTLDADIRNGFALKADIRAKESKIKALKDEISELELQKTMDEREIKQLIKIKEENAKLEADKKILVLESDYIKKEATLREEYAKKEVANITNLGKEMKEIHAEILKRLPNVNARIRIGGDDKKE